MANVNYDLLDENGLLFLWQQLIKTFVQKQTGKDLSANDFTDELKAQLEDLITKKFDGSYNSLQNIPQINNVELKGNKTLDDLGITAAITEAMGSITQISFEFFDSFDALPTAGKVGVFYLVKSAARNTNSYDEYIWNTRESIYELLGEVRNEIDLTGYVKHENIHLLTNDEILQLINQVESA